MSGEMREKTPQELCLTIKDLLQERDSLRAELESFKNRDWDGMQIIVKAKTEELEKYKADGERMAKALSLIPNVLNDAIHIYAPEFCDKKTIQITGKRVAENGGTLAYFVTCRMNAQEALDAHNRLVEGKHD